MIHARNTQTHIWSIVEHYIECSSILWRASKSDHRFFFYFFKFMSEIFVYESVSVYMSLLFAHNILSIIYRYFDINDWANIFRKHVIKFTQWEYADTQAVGKRVKNENQRTANVFISCVENKIIPWRVKYDAVVRICMYLNIVSAAHSLISSWEHIYWTETMYN